MAIFFGTHRYQWYHTDCIPQSIPANVFIFGWILLHCQIHISEFGDFLKTLLDFFVDSGKPQIMFFLFGFFHERTHPVRLLPLKPTGSQVAPCYWSPGPVEHLTPKGRGNTATTEATRMCIPARQWFLTHCKKKPGIIGNNNMYVYVYVCMYVCMYVCRYVGM